MQLVALAWLFAALGAGGCDDPKPMVQDAAPHDTASTIDADPYTEVVEIPITPNRDVDILFVIDDSQSMLDKQANLINNFPNFINVLTTLPGGLPNIHLGVVTTDMGTKGSGSMTPGMPIGNGGTGSCGGTGKDGVLQLGTSTGEITGNFISDIADASGGPRITNYMGDLATVFGHVARVGANGCGFEQPLAAMKRALDPSNAANQGFIRANALLAVVFLTDEDDCSVKDPGLFGPASPTLGPLGSFRCTRFGVACAVGGATPDEMNMLGAKDQCGSAGSSQYIDPVSPYHDFLVTLKGNANHVVVAAISGPPAPVVVEESSPGNAHVLGHACMYQGSQSLEVADPTPRLSRFLASFLAYSSASSICNADLSGALVDASDVIKHAVGSPCLDRDPPDSDPTMAGVQFDCVVEDIVDASVTEIAACPVGGPNGTTCWRVATDVQNCPTNSHYALDVVRFGAPPDPTTITRMKCKL